MANIIISENSKGLVFYLAKKDLEEQITHLEFNSADRWGGVIELGDGSRYVIDVLDAKPRLPISLRARRESETA
ncbi:MAG: putative nitrogen fixation protein NifT [Gammaproteobacteria bacterium]|nr:putative nitrogen fixation protein NifT [Gammaproteobacteria bacterium]